MDSVVNLALFPFSGKATTNERPGELCEGVYGLETQKDNRYQVMLFSHGNATTVVRSWESIAFMGDTCRCNVVAYEYPGYSGVNGHATPESVNKVADKTYQYLLTKYKPRDIILVGQSVGSGPTCYLAKKYQHEVNCVFLISPFTSIHDMVMEYMPWGCKWFGKSVLCPVVCNSYNNVEVVKSVTCPLFVVHGEEDEVIPSEMGDILLESCPSMTKDGVCVKGKNHNSLHLEQDVLLPFLEFGNKNALM